MTRVVNASCLILYVATPEHNILCWASKSSERPRQVGPRRKGPRREGRRRKAVAGKAVAGKAVAGNAIIGKDSPCLPFLASLQDIAHYVTCTTCRDATAAVRLESDCWKRIEIIPLLNVDTKELKSAENEFNLFNVRLTPKAGFHSIHF